MQRYFSVFVILAIVIGGGAYLYNVKAEQEAKESIAKKLSNARRSFAERARAAAVEPDVERYQGAIKQAVGAYEDELKKVVYAERPEWFDLEEVKKDMDERLSEREITEERHRGMMERYELVRSAHDVLVGKKWRPVLSQVGKADTRLDIYEVRRVRDSSGNPRLEARFFLWGIEPNTRIAFGQLELEYFVEEEPDAKTKRKRRREGLDPDAPVLRLLGRASGDATPAVMDPDPGRTIPQFPSHVAIGTLLLPQIPREAKVMDFRYDYIVRKGGAEGRSELVWEKMPVPRDWQLGEGEQWMADEVEAAPGELEAIDPASVDAGRPR